MKEGLDVEGMTGLTEEEAARRLRADGYNEIPSTKSRSVFAIAFEVVREPMFLLLLAGGLIYLLLGDEEEAVMLLFFVFVVMGITFYQERKTERALEALRDLSSPRALVIRSGAQRRIPGREVVRGDYIVLEEGDRVPADAVVLVSSNIMVDESLLTGESVPVRKSSGDASLDMARPGGEDLPFVYSGTLIVQGHGVAFVKYTASDTEFGKIGKALESLGSDDSALEEETAKLVKGFAAGGLALCAVVVAVFAIQGKWLEGLLAGIALAMAVLPEEIPVVFTIFLAIGAWRMSKRHVLTRRLQAIKTIGSATVLCVDKTGTITLNQMSVTRIFADGAFFDIDPRAQHSLPEEFHELMEYGILASQKNPFDPMEKGIKSVGERVLSGTEHIHNNWTLEREYALSKTLLALSHVWRSPDGRDYVIASKGAPEAIFDLCHLDAAKVRGLSPKVTELADAGLRVLGVARARFKEGALPKEQHDFTFEFLGLIGFTDPIRPGIGNSIRECYGAGIRVVMITGDYPGTARNIARQIGLLNPDEVISGPELAGMSPHELAERARTVNVFARVVPEQKLLLVNAFKADGEVVAMTGDGVNDAPALKSAHIGIAMGARGTDVARESASLVLLDDDFSSIVSAVKMGRRIFDNLRKALAYILSVHVPIAGMSLLPVVLKWPLALMPAHIAFLELIIDPACSVVFEAEPEEKDIMRRKPRRLGDPLFSRRDILLSFAQGLMVLLIVANVYALTLSRGGSEDKARALAFTTIVVANLALIMTNRSWSHTALETLRIPNTALVGVFAGTLMCLAAVVYVPFLAALFRFEEPHFHDFAASAAAGAASVFWFEGLKLVNKRVQNGILHG
jgi:P-type Ca2+ transporter type 2C